VSSGAVINTAAAVATAKVIFIIRESSSLGSITYNEHEH
jgi:hypothetical protein